MPIGFVPPNTTKASAFEFTADPVARNWESTQATSWYPGGDTFIPPGQPGYTAPVAFELWYKFKPGPVINVSYYSTFGCSVWNIGDQANYHPDETAGSRVTVEDIDGLYPVTGMRVQYYTNIIENGYYYFKIVTPAPTTVPITYARIRVEFFQREVTSVGAITVQDSHVSGAVVVLNKNIDNTFFNTNTTARHIFTAEPGHSIGGCAGDILPMSGITCIQDEVAVGVSLRNNSYQDRVTFAIGYPVQIRRDSHGSQFWISYGKFVGGDTFRTGFIQSIIVGPEGTGAATLGPVFSPFGVGPANGARALGVYNNTILYYSIYDDLSNGRAEGTIRRWNLQTNTGMLSFYLQSEDPATYIGRVTDILVYPNGDVIVGFLKEEVMNNLASQYIFNVKKFNSAGTIIGSLNFAPGISHGSVAFGETNEFFYTWQHSDTDSRGPMSVFQKFRVVDFTQVNLAYGFEFYDQALINNSTLYGGISTIQPTNPITPFGSDRGFIQSPFEGTSRFANFWINPFPIFIPSIPPTIPPPEIPPVNPAIGGGLIMLDPSNTVKHDVYMNHVGQPLDLPIKTTIRTAFLGD